jgi:hypothetical protein
MVVLKLNSGQQFSEAGGFSVQRKMNHSIGYTFVQPDLIDYTFIQ